eukprot:TRINITY_DN2122_c0_g1_i5.p1 TRINITY_DN2122_c0_g1~~TRINITY_DN2122_c0_g1_i5.p1  ORF type:complete len:846 (+),score=57.47 TRINITY_DN2122_c0_g1_i5:251-2788(+)
MTLSSWLAFLLLMSAGIIGPAHCLEYYNITSGFCWNGHRYPYSGRTARITTIAHCEAAAKALNWRVQKLPTDYFKDHPDNRMPGCRISIDGRLDLNKNKDRFSFRWKSESTYARCESGAACACICEAPEDHFCVPDGSGAVVNVSKCPKGRYCPSHTRVAVDCPANTYSGRVGLSASSACTPCPSGTSSQAGSTLVSQCRRYFTVTQKICPRYSGAIETRQECEAAATCLQLTPTKVSLSQCSTRFGSCYPGCFLSNDSLHFTRGFYRRSVLPLLACWCSARAGRWCIPDGSGRTLASVPQCSAQGWYCGEDSNIATGCPKGEPNATTFQTALARWQEEVPSSINYWCMPDGTGRVVTEATQCPAGWYCGDHSNLAESCPETAVHSPLGSTSIEQCYKPRGFTISIKACDVQAAITNTVGCRAAAPALSLRDQSSRATTQPWEYNLTAQKMKWVPREPVPGDRVHAGSSFGEVYSGVHQGFITVTSSSGAHYGAHESYLRGQVTIDVTPIYQKHCTLSVGSEVTQSHKSLVAAACVCLAGTESYCVPDGTGSTVSQARCPSKYYCGSETNTAARCPGTAAHSPPGSSSIAQCYTPGYYERTSGQCGGGSVDSISECQTAAKALDWPSKKQPIFGDVSKGCYLHTLPNGSSVLHFGSTTCTESTPCACFCLAPHGSFCDVKSNGKVASCPAGSFAHGMGATDCQTCPANTYSEQGATECRSCPLMNYSEEGSKSKGSCTFSAVWIAAFFFLGGGASLCVVVAAVQGYSTRVREAVNWLRGKHTHTKIPACEVELDCEELEEATPTDCEEFEEFKEAAIEDCAEFQKQHDKEQNTISQKMFAGFEGL